MSGDKRENVRFRVVTVKEKVSQKNQKKYRVAIDGVDKIVGLFDDRHDLQIGVFYVCESVESSDWTPPTGGSPITTYFTNGKTVQKDGAAPAPQQEAPPKSGDPAPDVYETLRGIVKVAKGIKDFAQDEVLLKDTKFDPEDIRTMMIEAFRSGCARQIILQDRRAAAQTEQKEGIPPSADFPF